ncbi:MAG: hypothetical protein ACOVOV_00880, partial [Dolichospermum sp.]
TAINAGTHQGVITIALTGYTTEPAMPTALSSSGTGAAIYTSISIKPSGGNRTISSNASPTSNRGIIELNGADNVTIDGDDPLTTGSKNLIIQSATSTTSIVACVRISSATTTNGATNCTVKNCILLGSRPSATATNVSYGIN